VVPFGVQPLTMWWALGIATTLGLFHQASVTKSDSSPKTWWGTVFYAIAISIGLPLMSVLFGWFFHSMMT
jgi:hypothetical protein